MDVLHANNNCRGQSDALRRSFKSGPYFVHSLTSASEFEKTVVRSIIQALQPALARRQFKSKQNHLHSLTKYCANSTSRTQLPVRLLKLFNLKAGTRMLQLVPAPMNNHAMCPACHFGWPNKRFKSFASLSGTACRSPLT
jgi:hypothetical protein